MNKWTRLLSALVVLSLLMTSYGCSTPGTKQRTPSAYLPEKYQALCLEELPDAKDGSREELQRNRKLHQEMYHDCAQRHNGTIKILRDQGVI